MKLEIKLSYLLTAIINIQNGNQHNILCNHRSNKNTKSIKNTAGIGVVSASCYTNNKNPVH